MSREFLPSPAAVILHGIGKRSGTNFLQSILLCHPSMRASPCGVLEFPHLDCAAAFDAYCECMTRHRKIPGLTTPVLRRLIGQGLLSTSREGLAPDQRLLLKMPSVTNLGRFFEFFDGASLVVVVRDGRDIVTSLDRSRFGGIPVRRYRRWRQYLGLHRSSSAVYAETWALASRGIAKLRDSIAAAPARGSMCVVRYEDLVGDFDQTVHVVLAATGLDAEAFDWKRARELCIRGSSFLAAGDSEGKLDWKQGAARMETDLQLVGRWRSWPLREIRHFTRIAGGELARWGYPLE